MTILYVVIGILVVAALYLIFAYNGLVRKRNRAEEAWSDIDVQLKRRYNLIPNLVKTVKGYASQEKEVFQKVTEARSKAINAKDVKEQQEAENALSNTLKSLFAVSENYPNLKSSSNFLELQRELSDTENKIQAARRFYNTNVRDLNTKIESFPTNLIADLFNFEKMDLFEIENPSAKKTPQVNF